MAEKGGKEENDQLTTRASICHYDESQYVLGNVFRPLFKMLQGFGDLLMASSSLSSLLEEEKRRRKEMGKSAAT